MPLNGDPGLAALVRGVHVASASASLTDGTVVPVVDGSVTVDATRAVRRSLSLTTVDVDGTLLPTGPSSSLSPYSGQEVTVTRSATDPATGATYTVQQGVFAITAVSLSTDDGGVRITVRGDDRASVVASQRVENTLTLTSGKLVHEAIGQIMDALPLVASYPRSLTASEYIINTRYVTTDADPWEAVRELALAAGHEAYFDTTGTLRTVPLPSLSSLSSPDWAYLEDATNVVVDVSRELTVDGVHNGVILVGSGVDWSSSVRAEVYDTLSTSPTGASGKLGQRPERVDSPYVRTAAQASAVATSLLSLYVGSPLDISLVPNPAMDVRDVVQVQSTRLGFTTNMIVDTIDLPLNPVGTMRATGRSRTL